VSRAHHQETISEIYKFKTSSFLLAGVSLERVPPLPIPNREVKALEPDDTCCFGGRESRVRRHTKALMKIKSAASRQRLEWK